MCPKHLAPEPTPCRGRTEQRPYQLPLLHSWPRCTCTADNIHIHILTIHPDCPAPTPCRGRTAQRPCQQPLRAAVGHTNMIRMLLHAHLAAASADNGLGGGGIIRLHKTKQQQGCLSNKGAKGLRLTCCCGHHLLRLLPAGCRGRTTPGCGGPTTAAGSHTSPAGHTCAYTKQLSLGWHCCDATSAKPSRGGGGKALSCAIMLAPHHGSFGYTISSKKRQLQPARDNSVPHSIPAIWATAAQSLCTCNPPTLHVWPKPSSNPTHLDILQPAIVDLLKALRHYFDSSVCHSSKSRLGQRCHAHKPLL